jgi:hypothetical protein
MARTQVYPTVTCDNCGISETQVPGEDTNGVKSGFGPPYDWGSAYIGEKRGLSRVEYVSVQDLCPMCLMAAGRAAESALKSLK